MGEGHWAEGEGERGKGYAIGEGKELTDKIRWVMGGVPGWV